ncbi:MAG: rhodanese-like domain-containing protein [Planctomyces sp.]|nr:rhodanese-like domain-containing protein [Planctomyces sp.]
MSAHVISPRELHDLAQQEQPVDLIDVRTPMEFDEVHVSFARNVPLDQLDCGQLAGQARSDARPLYVICRSGSRGRQAAERLVAAGHPRVVNVEGGTLAWDQAGLPVVRGRQRMSLERQVRIAAGLLVMTGTLLGVFVHPAFLGLAGFVGAGLVFAGVTDTCGMGLLLARMPWNRVSSTPSSGAACARV